MATHMALQVAGTVTHTPVPAMATRIPTHPTVMLTMHTDIPMLFTRVPIMDIHMAVICTQSSSYVFLYLCSSIM